MLVMINVLEVRFDWQTVEIPIKIGAKNQFL